MGDECVVRTVRIPLVVPERRVTDLHWTRVKTAHCQQPASDLGDLTLRSIPAPSA